MEFYRPADTRKWLRSFARSATKNKRRMLILVGVGILVLYLLFDNKGVIARIRLELQEREMRDRVRQTELQNDSLRAQIKALQGDKKTIETIAREKYGMTRPGETQYRVQKEDSVK
ncbi:MAG: septum formation initiator family protein [Bacteroidetes bacterium]|jgi:cell division protein FtsB|nr:septum formation initiator family protein [Bacteroidota bacterium]